MNRFCSVLSLVLLALACGNLHADQPLMTLKVPSSIVGWQEEFVLTLEIYSPAQSGVPEITIDGMDQFELRGTGKNLLQVPHGKTQKWIFTYTLTAVQDGGFRLGPARTPFNGRMYYSNILLVHVEPPPVTGKQKSPEKEPPPAKMEQKPPVPESKKGQADKSTKSEATSAKKPESKLTPPRQPEPKTTATKQPALKQQPAAQKPGQQQPAKSEPPKQVAKQPPPKPEENKSKTTSPPQAAQVPAKQPDQTRQERAEEKPAQKIPVPMVMSPAAVRDQIEIVLEAAKGRLYRYEGVAITLRLLAQLPVEDLRFRDEADFPGFLKYDLPFSTRPKGEKIQYRGKPYASYELLKFLIFPLKDGSLAIPAVRCLLKVRVPSGQFRDADLVFELERSSNSLSLQVKPAPPGVAVGEYLLRNEIITDAPQSKVVRFILEGNGLLSAFEFPEVKGGSYRQQILNTSTTAFLRGEKLFSRKVKDLEITPLNNQKAIVVPSVQIKQLNPLTQRISQLNLPAIPLQFTPLVAAPKPPPALPAVKERSGWILFFVLCGLLSACLATWIRPAPRKKTLQISKLFRRKNLKLAISKSAAKTLYQQIAREVTEQDGKKSSLIESLRRHLPQEDWLKVEKAFRLLEWNAFSQAKPRNQTYGDLREICERVERLWLQSDQIQ